MSAVVENLTVLSGTIGDRRPHPALDGFDQIRLDVTASEPVPGKADLIHAAPGSVLDVAVRSPLLGAAAAGSRVRLRASRGGSGWIMAEPHPPAGELSIEPPP
jgi:hypothetical protein